MFRFIFVLWCLMISSVSVFGQALEADLRNSYNKYSIVKIDNQEALKKAKNQQPFKLETTDKIFQFILTPNDIRSEKYRAEFTDKDGQHSLPRGDVFTYTATTSLEDRSVSIVKDYAVEAGRNDIEYILRNNEKVTNLKIVREADFYPANTAFDPNGFYADFQLKQQICDSNLPQFSFHIQQEKKFTIIKALNVNFRCKEESMKENSNLALKQYEQELSSIFEREVIEKLRQNDSR